MRIVLDLTKDEARELATAVETEAEEHSKLAQLEEMNILKSAGQKLYDAGCY